MKKLSMVLSFCLVVMFGLSSVNLVWADDCENWPGNYKTKIFVSLQKSIDIKIKAALDYDLWQNNNKLVCISNVSTNFIITNGDGLRPDSIYTILVTYK